MNDSIDYQQALSGWQQEREKSFQSVRNAATDVIKILELRGITQIEFDYYGGGDDGCIDDCLIEGTSTMSPQEREKLEDLVYQLLPSGWEINEGSAGRVTFDLETGEVSLSHKWLEYVEDDSVSGLQLELKD